MTNNFEKFWFNFWYKYIPPDNICYGGARKGRYEFRKDRLNFILFIIIIFLIIILM